VHSNQRVEVEAAEDIFFGQTVMHWARWFLIVGGIVMALWTIDDATRMAIGMVPIVALMAMNFYLHGRQLAQRPANPRLIAAASLLDLGAITMVVLLQGGVDSWFFIMYYPVVLAFAFVMRPVFTLFYACAALLAYTGVCFVADPLEMIDMGSLETLVTRLVTVGAMGGLGAYYWRIQRDRRQRVASRQ